MFQTKFVFLEFMELFKERQQLKRFCKKLPNCVEDEYLENLMN